MHPQDESTLEDMLHAGRANHAPWDLVVGQVNRRARQRRVLNGDGTPTPADVQALLDRWRAAYP